MDSNDRSDIIPLNIVTTYPVKWSRFTMISNFVQNFFDSLGPERFGRDFKYCLSGDVLMMSSDKGFSKEWLYYVGTSTKRTDKEFSAGCFGEGFKIASLVAVRDYRLCVAMESRDWWLHVTDTPGEIGDAQIRFLAYKTGKRPFQENAVLRLKGADEKLLEETVTAIARFYYAENPYFGRCLAKGKTFAIYEVNEEFWNQGRSGSVFMSYEQRVSLYHIPLVFCNHSFRPDGDDRDRSFVSAVDCRICIAQIVDLLSPVQALDVLEHLRLVWYRPKMKGSLSVNWTLILEILCEKIRMDDKVVEDFLNKYWNQLLIPDTKSMTVDQVRRTIAREWFLMSNLRGRYHLVHPVFYKLGIRTVCMLCEEYDGFTYERDPVPAEKRKLQILRDSAEKILGSMLGSEPWPACRILTNKKAPVQGYTLILRKGSRERNSENPYGLRIVGQADHIYLQQYLFQEGSFPEAFATYAHELLHRFGGDRSLQFHRALMIMNELVLEHISCFEEYEKRWKQLLNS